MATRQQVQYAYGISQEIITLAPLPIVAQRAPTSNDFEQPGQTWIDRPNNAIYFLSTVTANVANWQQLTASGGPGAFSSLTVNPGNITVTAGNVIITAGNLSTTSIVSPAALTVTPTTDFTLEVGAAGILSLSTSADDATINIATGAASKTVTIGSLSGASSLTLLGGANGINLDTSTGNGQILITSGTGVIGISADETVTTVSIGNGNGGTSEKTVLLGCPDNASITTIFGGTGGINLVSGGIFTLTAVTDTQASPSATAVINANVGSATFTGFTTAGAAAEVFTITNSLVSATSQIFCSVTNAGANDAQMTITRVNPGAGSFTVTLVNNGPAALNGNVIINFMVIG